MTDHSTPDALSLSGESATDKAASTVAVSVCFWCTLLTATVIYGTVALAPKLAVWQDVRSEYHSNIRQLVALEDDVAYLERVDEALQSDPEFLERLVGLNQQETDEELIPVSGSLLFGQSDEQTLRQQADDGPSLLAVATRRVATSRPLRRGLLIASATLTLFAFAFLNDAGAGFVQTSGQLGRRLFLLPLARYTRDRPHDSAAVSAPSTDAAPATARPSSAADD